MDRVSTSAVEDMTEGELWCELEKELRRQGEEDEDNVQEAREEEEAAAKEITEEENELLVDAGAMENNKPEAASLDAAESQRFYPPGRIKHIVSVPVDNRNSSSSSSSDDDENPNSEEHVGIYETPRELYSKLRLSRSMINDHYMPMYKKMMELLISELEKDEDYCNSTM